MRVTHGERVIDTTSGATKLDLVRYYESIAEFILPHLRKRPVSLVRGPSGVAGQLFFQKHGEKIGIPGIRQLDPSFWPEHAALLEVDTPEALVNAAQMNVIEFHTWNSTTDAIARPDRIVFDLDPGEGTTWKHVQEGATLVHAMLDELKLESWLKTSGGKGLHIVVPIATQARLRHRQGLLARGGDAPRRDHSIALRGEERRLQSGRQDLRRLPAQRARRDHRDRLLGARAARTGGFHAVALGRPSGPEKRFPVDNRHGSRISFVPEDGSVGRLLEEAPVPHGGDEGAGHVEGRAFESMTTPRARTASDPCAGGARRTRINWEYSWRHVRSRP